MSNTHLAIVHAGLCAVSHIKCQERLSSVGSWQCPTTPGTVTHQYHLMTVNRWIQSRYTQHIHDCRWIHLLASATRCYTSFKFQNTLHSYQLVLYTPLFRWTPIPVSMEVQTVLQCVMRIITWNSKTLDVHFHHNKRKTDYIKPYNFPYKVNAMICDNITYVIHQDDSQ